MHGVWIRDLTLAHCHRFESVASAVVGYVSELGKGGRNQRCPGGHDWKEEGISEVPRQQVTNRRYFFPLITNYVQTTSILSGEHSSR